jgi:integrase
MRFLTPEEVDNVAETVEAKYRALVLLLAYCGLRIGEAIALRPGDVDLLGRRVTVVRAASETSQGLILGDTKTGKNRSMSVPTFLCEEIAAHLAEFPPVDGLLFTGLRGRPITQSNFIRQVWYPAVQRAGIRPPLPRVHDLRHTAVALAVASGAHPKEIQIRLGHSSITVTLDRYGHVFPTLDDRLAMRLDEIARDARAAELVRIEPV